MTVPVIVKYNPVDCGLVGKKITFFEYMTTLGKDVACHTDLNDEGQGMGHRSCTQFFMKAEVR